MAALLRQLQISIELAAESVRVLPGPTGELADLCLGHLAHARALIELIADGSSSWTVGPGLPEHWIAEPSADRLAELVGRAREAAAEACLAASSATEVELLGMIAAALAGHEVVLRGLDG
jgi:hypothetical protein